LSIYSIPTNNAVLAIIRLDHRLLHCFTRKLRLVYVAGCRNRKHKSSCLCIIQFAQSASRSLNGIVNFTKLSTFEPFATFSFFCEIFFQYLNYKTANINVKNFKSLSQSVRVFVVDDAYKTANMFGAFSPPYTLTSANSCTE
jgi:hypothetical protein